MSEKDKNYLKEEALKILKAAFDMVIKEENDIGINKAIDDAFIEEIFDCAWNNQFSDDPSKFKREIRKIIRQTVMSDDEN